MKIIGFTLFLGIFISCLAPRAVAQTTTLTGVVTDDNQMPVAQALVIYTRSREISLAPGGGYSVTGAFVNSGVLTGVDGHFIVTGLPAGQYHLCARAKTTAQLNSCDWDGDNTTITAGPGSLATKNLVLRTGTIIDIAVTDPNGRILDVPRNGFRIGVISDTGEYRPATVTSRTTGTLHYSVAAPRAAALSLFLDTVFDVYDVNGAAVPRRAASTRIQTGSFSTVPVVLSVR